MGTNDTHHNPHPNPPSIFIVGLTGGIGSGKTAVTVEFSRLTVDVVDADVVAREVVRLGTEGLAEVVQRFGAGILDSTGMIDRAKLRQLVFANDEDRSALESILHPRIHAEISRQIANVSSPYCILCVPLLIEKGGYENVNRVLVVDCSSDLQRKRVMARDGMTLAQAQAIMDSQASRNERLHLADDIIENSDSRASLRTQVESLHAKYVDLAASLAG